MPEFIVYGPYAFQPAGWPQRKIFTRALANSFKSEHNNLMADVGCYVFVTKASKGMTPWYVGKTTSSFGYEAFTNDKLQKYNEAIAVSKKGTPMLFFLALGGKAGATKSRRIDELESYLVRLAVKKNDNLINYQKTKLPDWGIRGIVRTKPGTANDSSKLFKKALSLK